MAPQSNVRGRTPQERHEGGRRGRQGEAAPQAASSGASAAAAAQEQQGRQQGRQRGQEAHPLNRCLCLKRDETEATVLALVVLICATGQWVATRCVRAQAGLAASLMPSSRARHAALQRRQQARTRCIRAAGAGNEQGGSTVLPQRQIAARRSAARWRTLRALCGATHPWAGRRPAQSRSAGSAPSRPARSSPCSACR